MRTNKKTLKVICEDLEDAASNGEINIIDWLSDMNCAVEELAELGLKEALPVMKKLNEIGKMLKIINKK